MTEVLFRLREEFFKENIIIHDLRPTNCMVQFDTPADWRIRIVDGIGSPTLLPVVYYVDFLGRSHARREWVKLIRRIVQYFPVFFTDEELCELMEIR